MITDNKGIFIYEWDEAYDLPRKHLKGEDFFKLLYSQRNFLNAEMETIGKKSTAIKTARGVGEYIIPKIQEAIRKNTQGKDGEQIIISFLREYYRSFLDWEFPEPGSSPRGDGGDLRVYKPGDRKTILSIPEVKSWEPKGKMIPEEPFKTIKEFWSWKYNQISMHIPRDRTTGKGRKPTHVKDRHIIKITFIKPIHQIIIQGIISGTDFLDYGKDVSYGPNKNFHSWRIEQNDSRVISFGDYVKFMLKGSR